MIAIYQLLIVIFQLLIVIFQLLIVIFQLLIVISQLLIAIFQPNGLSSSCVLAFYMITAVPLHVTMSIDPPCPTVS